jgi:hypothetical protein
LVHSDICGPMPHQSLGEVSYFITCIDDTMWKVWAYPTRTKNHVFTIFKDWLAMVENQTDQKSNYLQSDNGESISLTSSSNFAENATLDGNLRLLTVWSKIELQNRWIVQSRIGLFLCCTISDLRTASGRRRYSQPCTLSTCRRVGLLDRKFHKIFGQEENRITESCGYLDAKRTHL